MEHLVLLLTSSGKQKDRRTDTDDIELEAALQELLLDLTRDAVETDGLSWVDRLLLLWHLGVRRGGHFVMVNGLRWISTRVEGVCKKDVVSGC